VPHSCPSLPQYVHTLAVPTTHCRYSHCMPASAISCTASYTSAALPLNEVQLCCLIKLLAISQVLGLMLWWRADVTTLLTSVLSLLKVSLQVQADYIMPPSCNLCISPLSNTILMCETSVDNCNVTKFLQYDPSSYLKLPVPFWFYVDCHNSPAPLFDIYILYLWYHLGTSHLLGQQY
jgi:hypothetical protein